MGIASLSIINIIAVVAVLLVTVRLFALMRSMKRAQDEVVNSLDELNLQWIGNRGMGSSNMHWMRIGPEGDSLFVSADTGMYAVP